MINTPTAQDGKEGMMKDKEIRAELERIDPDIAEHWDLLPRPGMVRIYRLLAEQHKALREIEKRLSRLDRMIRLREFSKGDSIKHIHDMQAIAKTAIKED